MSKQESTVYFLQCSAQENSCDVDFQKSMVHTALQTINSKVVYKNPINKNAISNIHMM